MGASRAIRKALSASPSLPRSPGPFSVQAPSVRRGPILFCPHTDPPLPLPQADTLLLAET